MKQFDTLVSYDKETKQKLYFLGDLDSKITLDLNHKKWMNIHFRINDKDFKVKNISSF